MMGWSEMKYVASAVAFAGAAVLAYRNKEGWGWLIFAGIMVGTA